MKHYAITGGIGTGKSSAVKIFQELGIPAIDADVIARKVREPGQPAHAAILERFGTDDRAALRKVLVSDPKAKEELEAILHPYIKIESEKEFARVEKSSTAPFLLYEATLIIEAGRSEEFDGIIVVTAPEMARIERIQARDSVPEEAARAMINAQISDASRLKFADYELRNRGSHEDLRQAVIKLLDQLKQA